ncbi:hypothetical protein UFOVP45_134 [uncultured Caudovirales phage]|uniref:Uncharacterized protein n=1 Tax=uncultured Caudovirales phage TaxID=2100421 RepID=A0A6J5KSN5_9CAUD|nr:hypothetical protein UFOVP45_134 [uncultured Caudovirales phage]
MILYHGTNSGNAENIKKNGFQPSTDEVPAGASGVYLSSSIDSARTYGDHILKVSVPDHLKIHPDIAEHPELNLTRRRNQYDQEKFWNDDADEYYEPEERTGRAADVSDDLEKKGYAGHHDSMVDRNDVVVYNPAHIKVVDHIKPNLSTKQFGASND